MKKRQCSRSTLVPDRKEKNRGIVQPNDYQVMFSLTTILDLYVKTVTTELHTPLPHIMPAGHVFGNRKSWKKKKKVVKRSCGNRPF